MQHVPPPRARNVFLGESRMAAKQPGRRAPRTAPGRRRWLTWLPWVLGLLIGLGAGAGMILIYPPPSTDMIKVQAVNWYASMRNLVAPSSSGASAQSRSEEHTSELQSRGQLVCR